MRNNLFFAEREIFRRRNVYIVQNVVCSAYGDDLSKFQRYLKRLTRPSRSRSSNLMPHACEAFCQGLLLSMAVCND